MIRTFVCAAVFAVAVGGAAQSTKAADFDWMAGTWTSSAGGNTIERTCSNATGGSMMCMMRVIAGGNVVWLEFTVLRDTAPGLVLDSRFFTPDTQPAAPISASLFLKTASSGEWAFENPTGNQPKRETIRHTTADEMTVHADLVDDHGKITPMDSTWHRLK